MTDKTPVPNSLPERIDRARAKAVFYDVFKNRFDSTVVRQCYDANQQLPLASADTIRIPHPELLGLVSELESLLGPYRSPSSGSVGNQLYFLTGSLASPRLPSVEDYAKILVLAAARIGPERVAELLSAWLRGEPLRVDSRALLKGLKTEGELRPVDGMRLETLGAHKDFPKSLRIDAYDIRQEQFGGRAMLSIEYRTDPALYDPSTAREESSLANPRRDLVNPVLASVTLDTFCRAMSLVADNHVDWFIAWEDFGDIEAFLLSPGFSSNRKETTHPQPVVVSDRDLQACLQIHGHLDAFTKLDLAIARWRRSKRSTAPHEQLIELRIALESVLLSDDRGVVGEKRHRLAIRGAWFLGSSFAERKKHFATLRALYDYASSVIHAGSPTERGSAPLERTVSDAQGLCRQAILRIVRAKAMPDWTDVILALDSG